jgi:glycosyltransferase 2 family protein
VNFTSRTGKPSVLFYLRLAVAVLLLLILLSMIDFHHMGLALTSVKPHLIVAGLLSMLLNYGLKTYRWASLVWIRKPDIPFSQLLRFNFLSIFLGYFLPTSLSSDIVRVYYVSRHTADPRAAISSIFADRIIGTFSLAIVTIIAFLILKETQLFPIGSLLSFGIVGFLFLTLALPLTLRSQAVLHGLRWLLDRFAGRKLFESIQDMAEHLRLYGTQPAVITKVLSISFLNLFIAVLEFYLIAKGFSAPVSIGYFFVFIPLVIFLATLPVSMGGLGLIEGGLVLLFSKVGMPVEMCLGTALIYRGLQLTCMLPGAAIYLTNGFSVKELSA